MKSRNILSIILLTVILLVGCAPNAATNTPQPGLMGNEPEPTPIALSTISQPEMAPTELPTGEPLPTEAPTEIPQVVATSRGPNLEASDPTTYTRASGELQLVEFFAFW